MPSTLRARVAIFVFTASLLIPALLTSLGGLTHVLTCEERVETPFTFQIVPGQDPILLSSQVIMRDDPPLLCEALSVDLTARSRSAERVAVDVPITNHSEDAWHGTVLLELAGTTFPVGVGEVPPGSTEVGTVDFQLDEGSYEVAGSLFIGP
jgi:hypothetical protein